jgi:hypothetical protein
VIDIGWISFHAAARECLPMAHPQLSTRHGHVAPADQPDIRDGVGGRDTDGW